MRLIQDTKVITTTEQISELMNAVMEVTNGDHKRIAGEH